MSDFKTWKCATRGCNNQLNDQYSSRAKYCRECKPQRLTLAIIMETMWQ